MAELSVHLSQCMSEGRGPFFVQIVFLYGLMKMAVLSHPLPLQLGRPLRIHEINSFLMTQHYDLILDVDP